MIGIYKITSPSGKVYVGQSVNIEKRFTHYRKLYNCQQQHKLYSSLGKYGASAHIFEVLESCSIEELNIRERYWQDLYNAVVNGLNCKLTNTGDKSGHLSLEVKKNISKSLKALYSTPEGKEIRKKQVDSTDKDARARKTVNNTDYVKRRDSYDWVSLHEKRVKNTDYAAIAKKRWVKAEQYSKDHTFIKEWSSIKEAGEVLGIERGSISGCCRGKYKSAGGFIWKHKDRGNEKED
jgi:group I intron endonuclease